MLDIMYEIPKDDNIGEVTITGDYINGTGGPVIDIRTDNVHVRQAANAPAGALAAEKECAAPKEDSTGDEPRKVEEHNFYEF